MPEVPEGVDVDGLAIAARTVLLDALQALTDHLEALVLVGAQAVYLHTGTLDLGVAAYTTDADLGLDPDLVGDDPRIEQAMAGAGFSRHHATKQAQPGTWWKHVSGSGNPVEVDLMVPSELVTDGQDSRAVKVGEHDRQALRRTGGLGVAMVDNSWRSIGSLSSDDVRTIDVKVAGAPALLVAKAFKIQERLKNRRLVADKDASDAIGLMMSGAANIDEISEEFSRLLDDPRVGQVTRKGLEFLHLLFGTAISPGVEMAERALTGQPASERAGLVARAFMAQLPK